jgi:hypothetical protein
MNNITQECLDIVKDLVGHEYLYFDTALEVRTSPHTFPFQAWGVCVSPENEIYVMDGNQDWHKVEPNVGNAYLVLGSLYQRLQLLKRKYTPTHPQPPAMAGQALKGSVNARELFYK